MAHDVAGVLADIARFAADLAIKHPAWWNLRPCQNWFEEATDPDSTSPALLVQCERGDWLGDVVVDAAADLLVCESVEGVDFAGWPVAE